MPNPCQSKRPATPRRTCSSHDAGYKTVSPAVSLPEPLETMFGALTCVQVSQIVGGRLLVDGQRAKLHDVAAHVVGVVVGGALPHQLVLLLQGLLGQVGPLAASASHSCESQLRIPLPTSGHCIRQHTAVVAICGRYSRHTSPCDTSTSRHDQERALLSHSRHQQSLQPSLMSISHASQKQGWGPRRQLGVAPTGHD